MCDVRCARDEAVDALILILMLFLFLLFSTSENGEKELYPLWAIFGW